MPVYSVYSQVPPSTGIGTGSSTGTFGMMFTLSQSGALTGIWHYSGSGETALPSAVGIFDNATGTIVAGTHVLSPTWSGAAGSGWVKATFDGSVTLDTRAGGYCAVVYEGGNHTYVNTGSAAWPKTSGVITAPATGTINGTALNNGPFNGAAGPDVSAPNGSDATTNFTWLVDVEITVPAAVNGPVANVAVAAPMGLVQGQWRLMDGQAGRPGTGSSGTQPPAAGTAFTGPFTAGLGFRSTQATWLQGYWWWCAASGQDTTPVKFTLWQVNGGNTNTTANTTQNDMVVVPNSTVTSGTLTPGAWNYTALPAPLMLSQGGPYLAAVGYTAAVGVPKTTHQFGAGNPYAAGITNGPLTAFPSGSALTWALPQMPTGTSADPTLAYPHTNDLDDLYWLDVQVTTMPPTGTTWRAYPNLPHAWSGAAGQGAFTIGTQFRLSQSASMLRLWHYSPPTSVLLPTDCGVFKESDQTLVTGTHVVSPAWKNASGAAASPGDGWIYCDYTTAGIRLPAGNYRVATAGGAAGQNWFFYSYGYWSTDYAQDFGQGGVVSGPITVPDNASATAPGQSLYAGTPFAYPNTWNNTQDGENHWVDLEVFLDATPQSATARVFVAALAGTAVANNGTPVDARAAMAFRAYTTVTAQATMEFEAGQPVQTGLITLAEDPWTSMYPG